MIAEHPTELAGAIASLIRSDAIAARQIREIIPDTELYELLELPQNLSENYEETSDAELFSELLSRFSKAQILRRLK